MSTAFKLNVPVHGQKITIQGGKLVVPDQPIIPFIEGDGTGPDIWRASIRVLDAAVEKPFSDISRVRKGSGWFPIQRVPERVPAGSLCRGSLTYCR